MRINRIRLYSTVIIQEKCRQVKYILVKSNEVNIFKGKISDCSPLGKALLGHKEKENIQVRTPGGEKIYKILAVK